MVPTTRRSVDHIQGSPCRGPREIALQPLSYIINLLYSVKHIANGLEVAVRIEGSDNFLAGVLHNHESSGNRDCGNGHSNGLASKFRSY